MQLKELMVDTKSVWVDYPGMDGFQVEIAHLSRERLVGLRKSCVEGKFDRKLKMQIEELNEKKFVEKFTKETIKDWRGLKLSYVEQMMLVDVSEEDLDKELPYTEDNAVALVSNSQDFDSWLNDTVFDLDNFRTKRD